MSHDEFPLHQVRHEVHGRWISGRDGHWSTRRLLLAQVVDTRWVVQLADPNPTLNYTRLLEDEQRARWVAEQLMKAPNVLGETPHWTEAER